MRQVRAENIKLSFNKFPDMVTDHPRPPAATDPFREAREASPTLSVEVNGERIPLLLRMRDIRKACKNTAEFSNANPFHITLEPETGVRSFRQFPIESDPPEHTDYRAIVEPLFRRPELPEYAARMEKLVRRAVEEALEAEELEVVRDFALLQRSGKRPRTAARGPGSSGPGGQRGGGNRAAHHPAHRH